jgi:hypothetical protein
MLAFKALSPCTQIPCLVLKTIALLTPPRFEKSLYDLIRGLRNHKGNEREYIQNSLRECRSEIRGSDMGMLFLSSREIMPLIFFLDLKATALLKLVYLEMFGHDMSWASFNVLEVMSSPRYLQKRVGYLGAVQSFRPDTEVLMLATNLLKKVGQETGPAARECVDCVIGYHFCFHSYHLAPPCHPATCDNILARSFTAHRLASPTFSLTS